jgi:transposase
MVKRRIGLLPDAHRQGGIEIHTDRARLEVLHPRCASTLHFSRQHPSKHFDRAFGDRKIRGLAIARSPTQQPPTMRPPSFICSNAEDNPVRVIEVFVDELDLHALGFACVVPETTGRPAYHPATMLKIYVYGYINQIQSSRRLERETARNVEMMWLTGRLAPDFKTIADFRKDNGPAIRSACRQFVALCRGSESIHAGDRGDRRQPVQGRQFP